MRQLRPAAPGAIRQWRRAYANLARRRQPRAARARLDHARARSGLARGWLPVLCMRTEESASKVERPVDLLAEHHHALDEQLDRLVMRAQAGDPQDLRAEWTAFERGLLRHLEQEEAEILPAFARHDPAEARAILAEHAEIRGALLEMGMNLDLHYLRAEAVQDFARRLKAHASREDAGCYAWAAGHVTPGTWRSIKRSLRDAARAGRRFARLGARIM